nr:MDIS1-interacting receptor like kinase 2-like [Ziziphus jujuba var. spinosa]
MSHHTAFTSESDTPARRRHKDIMKLYGFCSHPQNSLLVCEFSEGGILRSVLNNEEKARAFLIGVKGIFFYMKNTMRLIFSISKLLPSNWISFAGTFGYGAPKLAYTFGVVTVEILLGEHPGDLLSSISSTLSSSSYALGLDEVPLRDILDQRISAPTAVEEVAGEVVYIAMVGLACIPTQSQRLYHSKSFPLITLREIPGNPCAPTSSMLSSSVDMNFIHNLNAYGLWFIFRIL